ncbi:amidohydrolase family protein [Psychromonas sp. GE-S-Ul-11]|uniref:amidohydrolase family protein n=1 Tax=Psychromonas sp. GE-S-Ul-11 TaxID=3241170 RepID=UPI003AADFA3A
MYALVNGIIYSPESVLTDHAVIIEGQLINAIVPVADLPSSLAKIDLQGQHLSPGFIDLQLNGCGGVMFNGSESEQTLSIMHSANLKSGTTSFLPTFITDSDQGIEKAMAATRQYMQTTSNQVLGLHLEGPYISHEKRDPPSSMDTSC